MSATAVRLAVAVSLATCLTGSAPAGHAAPACSVAGRFVEQGPDWRAITLPAIPVSSLNGTLSGFTRGPRASHFAVDQRNPSRLLITNGATVMRSTNGGCTWDQVFTIIEPTADRPYVETRSVISQIVWDPSQAGHDNVYLLIGLAEQLLPHVMGSYQLEVFKSSDAGRTWSAGGSVPGVGRAPRLAIAPSEPNRLYLTATYGTVFTVTRLVWQSTDRAENWTLKSQPPGVTATQEFDSLTLTVDPFDANNVWGTDFTRVRHSTNGGATFTDVAYDDFPDSGWVDVWRAGPTKPQRIVVNAPQGRLDSNGRPLHTSNGRPLMYRSDDGARTWRAEIIPKGVSGPLLHSPRGDHVLFPGGEAGVAFWKYDAGRRRLSAVPTPRNATAGLWGGATVVPARNPMVYMLGSLTDSKGNATQQTIQIFRGRL